MATMTGNHLTSTSGRASRTAAARNSFLATGLPTKSRDSGRHRSLHQDGGMGGNINTLNATPPSCTCGLGTPACRQLNIGACYAAW